MKNIKSIITLLLVFCLTISSSIPVYAAEITEMELPKILQEADEFEVTENGETYSRAYAIVDDTRINIEWNRMTNEISLTEHQLSTNTYNLASEVTELNFNVEFDSDMNPIYDLPYSEFKAIPLIVIVGEAMMGVLINLAVTIKVSGILYTMAVEIVETLRKKEYKHYRAMLRIEDGKFAKRRVLYIGDAFEDLVEAHLYFTGGGDVWSTTRENAESVARFGGARVVEEIDRYNQFEIQNGNEYYWHFHRITGLNTRVGGHSFYGTKALS